ncbi:RNA-binding protein [Sinomonas cellulolyticus]|uniref:ANTAR domain-containing protein n=1 Tax=Sinomonas cellulolyticus TaxID=2801916 RepID=A0ABS1K228_9MICC|nr:MULTISPECIES: ANTAR domain-containing protein [Sinomonas]MBL0705724.1 ANTAR domain-containing protein [Sinomonas cellulolyticus]GHG52135.1 RNA-binding protein [Sinomonas sp. KCTC 49339]
MAARPLHHPATPDPVHLLLAHTDLGSLLTALAARTHALLARAVPAECALVLRRRNHPALAAASSVALTRLVQERLADDDVDLASALDRGAATAAVRLPASWASGMAWGLDVGHLVVPVDAGPTARAALSLVGTVPVDLHERRHALARIGRVRNEASWVLRLGVRFADEEERSQHRAQAMEARTVIDVAVGVIMAQNRCSADEAFDILKRASNNRNVKLREVAAELVQRIHPSLPETAFSD